MLNLTREQWARFAPKCPAAWTDALFFELPLLVEAGILDNERRWCHFAATVYHETNAFKDLREDLNYRSSHALRKAWPSRFGSKSDAELKPLLGNPVGLADQVYGCYSRRHASVIGDLLPGEAWAWRGGGWFHTTFKPPVDAYCKRLGIVPTPPNALDDPVLTLRFAVIEWTDTGCNDQADANSIRGVAKAINTGAADSNIEPNGMDGRKAAFARAWKIWGEYGAADVPAAPITPAKVVGAVTTGAVAVEAGGRAVNAVLPAAPAAPVVPAVPVAAPSLPSVDLGAAKQMAETAGEFSSIGKTLADFAGFLWAHPVAAGAVVAAVAGVWLLPPLLALVRRAR